MKRSYSIFILCFLLFLLAAECAAAEKTKTFLTPPLSDEDRAYVDIAYNESRPMMGMLGFPDEERIGAYCGEPIEVMTFSGEDIRLIYVPVISRNKAVALISIVVSEGGYSTASFGVDPFCDAINEMAELSESPKLILADDMAYYTLDNVNGAAILSLLPVATLELAQEKLEQLNAMLPLREEDYQTVSYTVNTSIKNDGSLAPQQTDHQLIWSNHDVWWKTEDEAVSDALLAAVRDVHKKGVQWRPKENIFTLVTCVKSEMASFRIDLGAAGKGTAYVLSGDECWEVKKRSVPILEKLLWNGPNAFEQ